MKNLGKLLVGCAVSCSIMAGPVNAKSPCGGSGLTIGAGFKFGKSQYELKNNKIKPANERLADCVQKNVIAKAAASAANDDLTIKNPDHSAQPSINEKTDSGRIFLWKGTDDWNDLGARTVEMNYGGKPRYEKGLANVVLITGAPIAIDKTTGHVLPYTATREQILASYRVNSFSILTDKNLLECPYPNAPAEWKKPITTAYYVQDTSLGDDMLAKARESSEDQNAVRYVNPTATEVDDPARKIRTVIYYPDDDEDEVAEPSLLALPRDVARIPFISLKEAQRYGVWCPTSDRVVNNEAYKPFVSLLKQCTEIDFFPEYELGQSVNGTLRLVPGLVNFVNTGKQSILSSINSSHEAFSKSNIGRNFEKGAHWDGAIDLNLGWTQRFGDFSFYLGGIFEIPCIKKEYQIKDKALADLRMTNSNNSSNDNKNKKDETNKLGYTFEKKLSFGASLMGYYNVTRMVSIGAGVNIWKKRGEFKYNNTAELYLVNEGSNNAKLIEACGFKVDEFNADAKKAGYGEKSKNVSAWMFEPVVGINWFIKNFNISLKFGYMLGKKFVKDNFELSGKGMTFSVNLSYTIPMF